MATESFTDTIIIKDKKACEKLLRDLLKPVDNSATKKENEISVAEIAKINARKWKL